MLAALALAGCGSVTPGPGASGTQIGAPVTPTVVDGPPSPVFPLTLRRTGGIAGFDDTIVLRADGEVSVQTRTVHGRTCTLAGTQKQVLTALGTVRLDTQPPTTSVDLPESGDTDFPDRISIAVTDEHGRSIDLTDPSLGDVANLVGALVSDVTLSSPAATKCTTPAA